MQAAQKCTQSKSNQSQSPDAISHIKTQLAFIKTGPTADVERLHFVFVVADKDEGRATPKLLLVNAQAYVQKRVATENGKRRPDIRGPFAPSESLLLLAFANDTWI